MGPREDTLFFMRERRLPESLDATDADPDPREEGATEEPLENMDDRRRPLGRFFSIVDMAQKCEADGRDVIIVGPGLRMVFPGYLSTNSWLEQTNKTP